MIRPCEDGIRSMICLEIPRLVFWQNLACHDLIQDRNSASEMAASWIHNALQQSEK